jgi:hypothetical protein
MAQLGRAFIEVRADLSQFPGELRTKLEAALREGSAGLKMTEVEDAAGKAGERAGKKLAEGVEKSARDRWKSVGQNAATDFSDGFVAFLGKALFGKAAMWTSLIVAAGTAIANLMPAVYALAGAVPTVLGGLVGTAATLVMAFHGVHAAIGAAFSGNSAKLAADLQKLAPAARSFVLEIAALRPVLHGLQQDVQQAFFVQLEGSITRVTRTLLPTLHSGLTGLGVSLGQVGRQVLAALSTPLAKGALGDMFVSMRTVINSLAPALGALTRAFLTLMSAASPLVTSLGTGLAGLITKFSDWIAKLQNTGALAGFFQAGGAVLSNLGELLGNVLRLFNALVSGLNTGGSAFIGVLGTIVKLLADLFASAQGQQLLGTLSTLMTILGELLISVVGPLLPSIVALADAFGKQLASALIQLTPYLISLAQNLIPLLNFVASHADVFGPIVAGFLLFSGASKVFDLLVPAIEGATVAMLGFDAAADANPIGLITLAVEALIAGIVLLIMNWQTVKHWGEAAWHGIESAGKGVWEWMKGVGGAIGGFFSGIGDWFMNLPGRVGGWLASLPTVLATAFTNAVNAAAEALGFAIGFIIGEFFALPGQIVSALTSLGTYLVGVFTAAWTWVSSTVATGIDNLIIWFAALPGRIANAINSIPSMIGNAFKNAWDWARREVMSGADAVVDFARKLPGRLVGFFDNVGHMILNGLKSGINGVIDSFNSGIDKASSFTHISLPHIPRLGDGGIIDQPTLALLGEKGHREVVLPTDNPARAQELLEQSGLAGMMAQGASAMPVVNVTAILGTGEILKVLDTRVELKMNRQAEKLTSGVRAM